METIITTFTDKDLKKSGGFKKKNNVREMTKTNFFIYLKNDNLKISSDYIDFTGKITDGKRFKCSYGNMIIGTSGIVKEFNEGLK